MCKNLKIEWILGWFENKFNIFSEKKSHRTYRMSLKDSSIFVMLYFRKEMKCCFENAVK